MKEYLKQLIKEQPRILLKRSIAREYLQARVLQSLQERGAFLNMAFLGGTSLRFLYSIPRYSEDLDFSILPNRDIKFDDMLESIRNNFESENYEINIKKGKGKIILASFFRFPSLLYELDLSPHRDETLSVKLEIDINPPKGEGTETTLVRKYIALNILHYDKASLFAGKLHAILARKYTKGRDLFDLIWILSDPNWPEPNYLLLNNALKQTDWTGEELGRDNWKDIIGRYIGNIDWNRAIEDVLPFLERQGDGYLLTLDNCKTLLSKF